MGITLDRLGLIGLEPWWFLFNETKSQQAKVHHGVQEIDITVDGGCTPNQIEVKVSRTVRLNFFAKTPIAASIKSYAQNFSAP